MKGIFKLACVLFVASGLLLAGCGDKGGGSGKSSKKASSSKKLKEPKSKPVKVHDDEEPESGEEDGM